MPATAGQLVVEVVAGTSKLTVDLEAAKGKLREFGATGAGSMRQASAAVKVLEGNIVNNNRAAGAFLLMIPGLGKAVAAAFPVIGAVAFASVLGETAGRVRDFFKEMRESPEKVNAAFRSLTSSIRLSNNELQVSNDRLENDIAKLEGKRENTLKLALDQAAASADKLGESLAGDLTKINELLSKNENGVWDRILGGSATLKETKESIFGVAGGGGNAGAAENVVEAANQRIAAIVAAAKAKGTPAALKEGNDQVVALRTKAQTDANIELGKALDTVNQKLKETREQEEFWNNSDTGAAGINFDLLHKDIEALEGTKRSLQQTQRAIPLRLTNTDLTAKDEALKAADENAKAGNPFIKWQKESAAQLDALKLKLDAIGKPEGLQILAKAAGEAHKEIAKLNSELGEHHRSLTKAQEAQIVAAKTTEAQTEADISWRDKMVAASTSTEERISSQLALTAAIGAGYEATRKANIETQLAAELGQHTTDADFVREHGAELAGRRGQLGAAFDAQHGDQTAKTLQSLNDQIDLERELGRVVSDGAEAIRLATLAQKTAIIVRDNDAASAKRLIAAETTLSEVARDRATAKVADGINEEVEATDRLTDATLKGAAALRQARLENELAKIRNNQGGAGAGVPGVLGVSPAELDAARKAGAEHRNELAKTQAAADPANRINDEIAALKEVQATLGDTLAVQIKLRDLENERIHALAQETLLQKTAGAGVRAFFLEMKTQAKSTADIIYETLNSVVDQTSDNLAKLATEKHKKGDHAVSKAFGAEFTDIGRNALGSSIKSTVHTALGKLGKADGSDTNPFSVLIKNKVGVTGHSQDPADIAEGVNGAGDADTSGGGSSILKKLGGLFGGGTGLIKTLFGGFLAGGGDVDPGSSYVVGDGGEPELFSPKTAGSVTPLSKVSGHGSGDVHYHINAPGSELGAENRIARAVEQAHHSAVAQAVRATHERAQRLPAKRG